MFMSQFMPFFLLIFFFLLLTPTLFYSPRPAIVSLLLASLHIYFLPHLLLFIHISLLIFLYSSLLILFYLQFFYLSFTSYLLLFFIIFAIYSYFLPSSLSSSSSYSPPGLSNYPITTTTAPGPCEHVNHLRREGGARD